MIEGIVNILKPPGMTSSDVVSDVRSIFALKRVGHTGTLDPGAAGVLPVCVGRATRLFDYLVDKEKEYIFCMSVGIATDTEDSYGKPVAFSDATFTLEELKNILGEFTGPIYQTAPMYSALNHNGQKLYKLAREGQEVERTPRLVNIYALEVMQQTSPKEFLIKMRCSKGTYVRTLCSDMAKRLGTLAHTSFLVRSMSGAFRLEDTVSISELRCLKAEGKLLTTLMPMDVALTHLPAIKVADEGLAKKRLLNGCRLPYEGFFGKEDTPHRVYMDESFLGIGSVHEGEICMQLLLGEMSNG